MYQLTIVDDYDQETRVCVEDAERASAILRAAEKLGFGIETKKITPEQAHSSRGKSERDRAEVLIRTLLDTPLALLR